MLSLAARIRPFAFSRKSLAVSLVALLGAVGLTSCESTTTRYPLDSATIKTRGLQPNEGYIVAAYKDVMVDRKGGKGTYGAMTQVQVDGTGANKGSYAVLSGIVMPVNRDPQLMGGGKPSEVIAIPVKAGDYEITRWSMTGSGVSGPVTVSNRGVLKVPFRVKAGEATYVGNYLAVAVTGRNIIGMPMFADGMIFAKDDFAKDQVRIAKFYPTIRSSTIRKSNVAETYMSEMKRIAQTPDWTVWDMFAKKR